MRYESSNMTGIFAKWILTQFTLTFEIYVIMIWMTMHKPR